MLKKTITAKDIESLLSNRFCPPAWAFLPQVRNGTGYLKTTRTADAIAMGLWPSRGLFLHGFEIKIYRGDWLKELSQPEKAEEIAQFTDFWWIAAPKDLIRTEELPPLWGLMIPHGKTMKIIREAKQLTPIPIDKLFLAAILRRAQETITSNAIKMEAFLSGEKSGRKYTEESFKYEKEKHEELQKNVKKFEQISGVNINETWNLEKSAEAVKMVLNGEHLRVKEELKNLLKQSEKIVESIKGELDA